MCRFAWLPGKVRTKVRTVSSAGRLVIAQVAVSVLLLVTSLLFVRSLRVVQTADPGFNVRNQLLATVRLDVPGLGGSTLTESAMERIAGLPGVQSVTAAVIVPLSCNSWMTKVCIGNDAHREPVVQANAVGANYFATMGIRMLAGREFVKADSKSAPQIAVVNQTFARQFLGSSNPLGQRVSIPKGREREQWQIVGVAADSQARIAGRRSHACDLPPHGTGRSSHSPRPSTSAPKGQRPRWRRAYEQRCAPHFRKRW